MSGEPVNVLFVCTTNASLSIMAQAMLNKIGRGRFQAFSAGVHPGGGVNEHALETLKQTGYDIVDLHTKSWNDFAAPLAPRLDVVVSLDDAARDERHPIWFSNPVHVHWGFADPAEVLGGDAETIAAFRRCFGDLEQQMLKLSARDVDGLSGAALKTQFESISP